MSDQPTDITLHLRKLAQKLVYQERAKRAWETKRENMRKSGRLAPVQREAMPKITIEKRAIGAFSRDEHGAIYTRDAFARIWKVHQVDEAWFAYGPSRFVQACDRDGFVEQVPLIKRGSRKELKAAICRLGLDLSRYYNHSEQIAK